MSRFPRLTANGNESDFPHMNTVDVFQYDNDFDYSRFDHTQMNIILCKVPWDMGEAHVGNRTISGIGNVVYFGSKAERDKWFSDLDDSECFRFATKYRELHRDNQITVPVPYDVAARYNYIAVYYEPMANPDSLVEYEQTKDTLDAWFWFVREVEFLSPNSTRLHLLNDAWQTFIYDISIPYMMLERGHAPMGKVDAAHYLTNPKSYCSMLLAPEDEAPDAPRFTQSTHEHVFNDGTMYALVFTTANVAGSWGSKSGNDWEVPATQQYVQGLPSPYVFAVAASSFNAFLSNVNSNVPQFLQTVQAVCFIDADLVTLGSSFTFGGQTCYSVNSSYQSVQVHRLAKGDFGYPSAYANIAKLYTYPYSVLVVGDSDGNEMQIRIEDTDGTITASCAVSLVYPYIAIQGAITSVGAANGRSISFKTINNRNMPIGGNWHELLIDLNIPTFGVVQSARVANDYGTHFDRAQTAYAADNAQANANANAANTINNAAVTTAGNSAKTATANTAALADAGYSNDYTQANTSAANLISGLGQNSTIDAAERQGAIAATTGIANGAVGAIASGNPVGAAASLGSAILGAASTMASVSVAVGVTAVEGSLSRAQNNASNVTAQAETSNKATNQTNAQTSIANTENNVITSHAANDAATVNANAARDRATQTSAVSNQIAQAALGEPAQFGDVANGENAANRPLALYSHVLTQDAYTIRRCGDDFLRYGYRYGANWTFDGNWNVMKHFTYWRLSDFWVEGLQIPDLYVDRIRFFLFGGVTVWRNPDEIGKISLYENY